MTRVIKGWLLPNVGFKFRVDRPDGCGDMGVGVRRLEGGCNHERWLRFIWSDDVLGMARNLRM